MNIQRFEEKGVLCHKTYQGVLCCVSLVGGITALTRTLNEVRKLWFFVFMRVTLNKFMAFIDFLDFHNNWPECSWDINTQTLWGFEEIRNISLATSRSVTTTEIFPIGVNNGNNNCLIIVEVQNRFSQEQIGLSKKGNLAFLTESGAHYIV